VGKETIGVWRLPFVSGRQAAEDSPTCSAQFCFLLRAAGEDLAMPCCLAGECLAIETAVVFTLQKGNNLPGPGLIHGEVAMSVW